MKTKIAFVLLAVLLAASASFNLLLYRTVVSQYRDLLSMHLDPIGERHFQQVGEKNAKPAAGMSRVLFIGDSSIEQWEELPLLTNCQTINHGVGGDTSAQVRLRLERDVLNLQPDIVVIEAGSNDLKTIGVFPDRERVLIENCKQNLNETVAGLRKRGVHVVLLTIFPVGPVELSKRPVWSDATLTAIAEVNQYIRGLHGERLTVVDCDPVLATEGRLHPAYAQDMWHLTPAGYQALNEATKPVLESVLRSCK